MYGWWRVWKLLSSSYSLSPGFGGLNVSGSESVCVFVNGIQLYGLRLLDYIILAN